METQKKRYSNVNGKSRMIAVRLPHELKKQVDSFLATVPGRKRQTRFVIEAIKSELARRQLANAN